MMPGKIKLKKYLKIRKGTKNVRNPHILRTLPIHHLFEVFKFFLDFILIGYSLNRIITLRRWSNGIQKNLNPKILKN